MKSFKLISLFLMLITFTLFFVSCNQKEDFKSDFNEQTELLGLNGIPDDADVKPGAEYTTEVDDSVDLTVSLDENGVATSIIISSDRDDSKWKDYANCIVQQYKDDSMNPSLLDMILVDNTEEKDGYTSSVRLSGTALAKVSVSDGVRTLEIVRTVD